MAALSDTAPTYLDWARRLDPDGNIATIVEILSEELPMLEDAAVVEGNDILSHRTTVRSGLPTGTWRKLNYGVPVEKGKTKQITDTIGSLESYGEVDKDLALLNGNSAAWRLSEEAAFIEGLSQTMGDTIVYGNTDTDPEKFLGLTERYNDSSAENARMIINGGGGDASTQSSIWGVTWGERSCHMTFPKGSTAGLSFQDLGEETLDDGSSGLYQGFRTHYSWKAGMVLRDWRKVTRIANCKPSELVADTTSILDLMIDAQNQLKSPGTNGQLVWYVNRGVKAVLDKEAKNQSNMALEVQKQDNRGPVTMFWGNPIKLMENLITTEAVYS